MTVFFDHVKIGAMQHHACVRQVERNHAIVLFYCFPIHALFSKKRKYAHGKDKKAGFAKAGFRG